MTKATSFPLKINRKETQTVQSIRKLVDGLEFQASKQKTRRAARTAGRLTRPDRQGPHRAPAHRPTGKCSASRSISGGSSRSRSSTDDVRRWRLVSASAGSELISTSMSK